ncbi:MAG: 4-phosphoerythronate dehydrogenase [Bacteroidales bacterium]|nr:4-phosphoerythronate dehydrogenase [Bacteroidales bacterium]
MKIVIDKVIPFVEGVLEPFAEVVYLDTGDIVREAVADADALIIRTRTRCDASLLEGSRVAVIATASIGTHHIDFEYCSAHGIHVCNASGCNSGAVMNYVFSALYGTASRHSINLSGYTMGIIGAGNVGSRVEQMALYLGFKVLKYDSLRAESEGPDGFWPLEELLLQSNIVTMHVPINDTTRRMADSEFFARMRPGAFFINTAGGDLVDEEALVDAIPKLGPVIIDTWSNEPNVNKELLSKVDIATPHIANYSYQGKQISASTVIRAIARYFGFEPLYEFFPPAAIMDLEAIKLDLKDKSQGEIASVIQYNYPIFTDDFMFRISPDDFVKIRENYNYRREFYVDY